MRDPIAETVDFAEFERMLAAFDRKLEYIGGVVVAFAGETVAHDILCRRVLTALDAPAKAPCRAFTANMAVRFADDSYVFPDASYSCEEVTMSATSLRAPELVVEVLSTESIRRDRVEKLDLYQSLESVREYVLIDSRRLWVCRFRREANGWSEQIFARLDDRLVLTTLPVTLPLAELYDGVLDPA